MLTSPGAAADRSRRAGAVPAVPRSPNRIPNAAVVQRRFGLSGLLLAAWMTLIPSAGFAQDCLQWADRTPPTSPSWGRTTASINRRVGSPIGNYRAARPESETVANVNVAGPGTCGQGQGDCCVARANPGCQDVSCCQDVCAFDSYCCDVEWDQTCVDEALQICAALTCGLPPVCGNGIVEPGEECDPPNDVTCDSNCQLIAVADPPQGDIVAWGLNGSGQTTVPAPNSRFIAVAAGWVHSLGLKADGSIVAWGSNYNSYGNYTGQSNVPSPNTGFVAVAAGVWHSMGLKADGSIVAWGSNAQGQTTVPAPNSGFVAIAGGGSYSLFGGDHSHSLGLKADRSIVAWGANRYGETNVPAPNSGFVGSGHGFWH